MKKVLLELLNEKEKKIGVTPIVNSVIKPSVPFLQMF